MCTGLACLVNAIKVDSSYNAINPADFVAPGEFKGKVDLISQLLPKAETVTEKEGKTVTSVLRMDINSFWSCEGQLPSAIN